MITAKIVKYDGTQLVVIPDENISRDLLQRQVGDIEIILNDGRTISADQRKKIFAIIRDISLWSGHDPEYLRQLLTWDYRGKCGLDNFSLSNVDMTTAKDFITYLIIFCFNWSVPTRDTLLHRTDDIGKYLYLCLEYRRCAICNKKAEVHHVNRIGMGRNREKVVHIGLKAIALCSKHHNEAHHDEEKLFKEHYIYGIKLDKYLCDKLNLNTRNKYK